MAKILLVLSQHSIGLVLAAALICALMASLVVGLVERTKSLHGRRRLVWMAAIAVIAGVGVWTTHFVAMLGFRPDLVLGYDPAVTLISALMGVLAVGVPFSAASIANSRRKSAAWGALGGLGIGAMHYTGMAALQGCAVSHLFFTTLLSLVFGASFASIALGIRPVGWRYPIAVSLLVLAVCLLHFTAVGGARLTPQALDPSSLVFEPELLGVVLSGTALMILSAAFAAVFGQIRLEKREQAEAERLAEQAELLSSALHNMSNGLVVFGADGLIKLHNQRAIELLNLQAGDLVDRMPSRDFIANFAKRNGRDEEWAERAIANHGKWMSQEEVVRVEQSFDDGKVLSISCRPVNGGGILTYDDVSDEREHQRRMAYLAHYDALTGLPNRLLFREELDRAVARAHRGETVSVLCLDLDHFKSVNDTLGHPIGDALLKAVAGRLSDCLRSSDTVARLGGDEFAVVQAGIASPEDATALAQRLIGALGMPYDLEGHQIIVGTSVGIALSPSDSIDVDQLLKCADMALYRAKADGRGTYRFFEAEMDAKMQSRRALEMALRKALQNDEFEVFYQPLVEAKSEQITGFEALLRWKQTERGYVPPSEFIPLAEEIGLIGRIGAWVLRQACCEAAKWPEHLKIAVNLSPVQFKGQALVLDVTSALGAAGLSPHRLELEVTETVMLQDTETTLGILHLLRELGVRISMDDFGTGYSSLSYLRKFPFDKIKIDQSFIRDLSDKADSAAIVRAVTTLSSDLGISTTAEGVETQEQFDRLRKEGCTEVQGYLFSRPRPAREIPAMLADADRRRKPLADALEARSAAA
ncbi:MAG TPA: EAL domain-containing protein [Mesorhizobium sp.]|jgi:diguanylate cyclase (GGDEF)-like protein|nr:EAL domain-containing protein [Mesorhizobium sp.]